MLYDEYVGYLDGGHVSHRVFKNAMKDWKSFRHDIIYNYSGTIGGDTWTVEEEMYENASRHRMYESIMGSIQKAVRGAIGGTSTKDNRFRISEEDYDFLMIPVDNYVEGNMKGIHSEIPE